MGFQSLSNKLSNGGRIQWEKDADETFQVVVFGMSERREEEIEGESTPPGFEEAVGQEVAGTPIWGGHVWASRSIGRGPCVTSGYVSLTVSLSMSAVARMESRHENSESAGPKLSRSLPGV